MSTIINFFGGPGIGKSTQSAELFTLMKKNHMDVELTFEYPKIVTWEENLSSIRDQFFITANQHRNISRLYGKVNYIIVDSPIILGLIYKNKYVRSEDYPSSFYDENFDYFILNLFKKYNNLNIFLGRDNESFNKKGRLQNLDESKIIDEEIKKTLKTYEINFHQFDVNKDTSKMIFNFIKENNI
jgi:hypothetical protein